MYDLDNYLEIRIDKNEDFKEYLNILFKKTDYVDYIILAKDSYDYSLFLDYFKTKKIEPIIIRKWPSTLYRGGNMVYRVSLTKEFKNILLSFDNFFIPSYDKYGQYAPKKTKWGTSDICFYDKNSNLLSYTTTHEGWIFANTKVLSELKKFEIK